MSPVAASSTGGQTPTLVLPQAETRQQHAETEHQRRRRQRASQATGVTAVPPAALVSQD